MAATSNPLVGIPITEKLSKTNYAMWEAQILAAIHGARLYRHLTGPTPAPSAEIDGEVDGKSCKVPNPAYNEWYATDQQVSGSSSPPSPLPITQWRSHLYRTVGQLPQLSCGASCPTPLAIHTPTPNVPSAIW